MSYKVSVLYIIIASTIKDCQTLAAELVEVRRNRRRWNRPFCKILLWFCGLGDDSGLQVREDESSRSKIIISLSQTAHQRGSLIVVLVLLLLLDLFLYIFFFNWKQILTALKLLHS